MSVTAYATAANMQTWLGARLWNLLDADEPRNELQRVIINGAPTGGTFTLTYNGQTTAAIAFNAAAAAVDTALEAISTIDVGDVSVTGADGGPYRVEFTGNLKELPIVLMTADGALLTGGVSPGVVVESIRAGQAPEDISADDRLLQSNQNANALVDAHVIARYDISAFTGSDIPENLIDIARKLARFDLISTHRSAEMTEGDVEVRRQQMTLLEAIRDGDMNLSFPPENRVQAEETSRTVEMGAAASQGVNAAGNQTSISPSWFGRY